MLLSNAVRLAQSQGLHCQPPTNWKLTEEEVLRRNWLFWVIYAYDKHVAFRSGRPSVSGKALVLTILLTPCSKAIDDNEIRCQIPTRALSGSAMNSEWLRVLVEHSRIASDIARNVNSAKASKQPIESLVVKVHELETRLREWRENMKPCFRPPMLLRRNDEHPLPPDTHWHHIVLLHFSYYGSLIALHSIFTYPWQLSVCCQTRSPIVREQISKSTKTVLEASRQLLLATKSIDPGGSWPTWYGPHFPALVFG